MKKVDYLYDNMKAHIERILNDPGDHNSVAFNKGYNLACVVLLDHLETEYKAASVFADTKTREENKDLNDIFQESIEDSLLFHNDSIKDIVEKMNKKRRMK